MAGAPAVIVTGLFWVPRPAASIVTRWAPAVTSPKSTTLTARGESGGPELGDGFAPLVHHELEQPPQLLRRLWPLGRILLQASEDDPLQLRIHRAVARGGLGRLGHVLVDELAEGLAAKRDDP